ncbi:hypothetical protein ACOME3_010470 [Neoechinorhynchus agilis]
MSSTKMLTENDFHRTSRRFSNRFEKRVDNDDRTKIDERFIALEKKLKEFEERNKIMKEIYSEVEEKLMSSFEDKSYKNNLSKNFLSPVLNLIKIHENKVACFVDDLQEKGKDLCGLNDERDNLLKKLSQKRQELFTNDTSNFSIKQDQFVDQKLLEEENQHNKSKLEKIRIRKIFFEFPFIERFFRF